MTEQQDNPTTRPAEDVLTSPGSALAADAVAPEWFVPQSTQDNYAQIARDQAAIRGVEPRVVMQEMAGSWQELHQRQPLDGYDHLAAWARNFDPAAGTGPSGTAVLQARALESARRDPYQAVVGDQALVEQAVASQQQADAAAAGAAAAPSVDPASGALPNPGPLPVPDVATGSEGDQQQQAAAAEQLDAAGGTGGDTSDTPATAAAAADATPAPSTDAPADSSSTDSSSTPRKRGGSTTS
jgi:hypothetical protein